MATPNTDQNNSASDAQKREVERLILEWRAQTGTARSVREQAHEPKPKPEPEPEPKQTQKQTEWWRYPLAILAFVVIIILGSILFNLVYHLMNYISPRAFQNSEAWMYFASVMFASYCACAAVGELVKANHKFCYVFLLIAFVYFLFVAITNYLTGASLLYESISTGACGILCLVMAVQHIKADVGKSNNTSA